MQICLVEGDEVSTSVSDDDDEDDDDDDDDDEDKLSYSCMNSMMVCENVAVEYFALFYRHFIDPAQGGYAWKDEDNA